VWSGLAAALLGAVASAQLPLQTPAQDCLTLAQAAADDVVRRLSQPEPSEADWQAALAALHELHALEHSCGAEFGSQVWSAYAAGLAIASNTASCKGYLPEEPLALLQRLALDPRTQRSFELRAQVEISLGVALRNEGRMHEARMRTLAGIDFVDSTAQWRASSWIELARDQTQLGEWSDAAAALECAERELHALAAGSSDLDEGRQLSFDLACARARLEIVLGRPDAAAAALDQARELEGPIADDFTRHQLLSCEVDLAYASDNDELLIGRLEEQAAAGPLAPEHVERLAFSYLDSRADDPRAQARAAQLLRWRATPSRRARCARAPNSAWVCSIADAANGKRPRWRSRAPRHRQVTRSSSSSPRNWPRSPSRAASAAPRLNRNSRVCGATTSGPWPTGARRPFPPTV
jgi:hypothetical protein